MLKKLMAVEDDRNVARACGNEWECEHATNCLPLSFTLFQQTVIRSV